ncbi:hypothetical protein D3C72_1226060 [compost metagenome]
MGVLAQVVGVQVRLATQLHDALGQLVSMLQLLGGMLEELLGGNAGFDPAGHVVVAFVAQGAHPFGGQRLVEQAQDCFPVGVVALGYGALLDMLAGALAQGFDIG